jgi:hypothetical protein
VSLTEAENAFAGINEAGLNDLMAAVFNARPRLLNYRTSPAVAANPANPTSWTTLSPLVIPGSTSSIDFAIQFSLPKVDLFPESAALPPPLALVAGQFAIRTSVRFGLLCVPRQDGNREPVGQPIASSLGVVALGSPSVASDTLTLQISEVELVDITPDDLESLLECLVRMTLSAVLSQVSFPLSVLRAGAFGIHLSRGPLIADDTIKVYGAP